MLLSTGYWVPTLQHDDSPRPDQMNQYFGRDLSYVWCGCSYHSFWFKHLETFFGKILSRWFCEERYTLTLGLKFFSIFRLVVVDRKEFHVEKWILLCFASMISKICFHVTRECEAPQSPSTECTINVTAFLAALVISRQTWLATLSPSACLIVLRNTSCILL